MIRSGAAACVLAILGVAACRQPPDVAFVTSRFQIAPEFDGELCGGNVAFMEARLAAIEELLEVKVEGKIRYNWVEDIEGFCPEGADACAEGTTIYGPWSSFEHELVHAAVASLGRAKPFLEEGLAVAFSEPLLAPGIMMPSEWLDFVPLTGTSEDRQASYATAGHFIRFLYEEFGPEPLTRLYRMSEYDDSAAQLRGQFEHVYGMSFDALEALYLDTAYDAYPSVFGCPEATMGWDGAAYVEDLAIDCSNPATLRTSANRMTRNATLRLDAWASGWLMLDGKLVFPSQFCATDPFNVEDMPNYFGRLGPGWHTVTVGAELDAPKTVSAEFRPESGAVPPP